MNSIINRSKNKRKLITLACIALLLLLGIIFLELSGVTNFVKQNQDQTQEKNKPTAEEVKTQTSTDNDKKKTYIENSTDQSPTAPLNSTKQVELVAKQEGAAIIVSTKLRNISDGECSLVVSNGSKTKKFVAPTLYQPEFSICEGYSIPLSELGSGNWGFELTVKNPSGDTFSALSNLETR